MSKEYAMKNQVSIMLQRDGFEKALKIVNETILEKQYSSTQTYWKHFKEELINQNKEDENNLEYRMYGLVPYNISPIQQGIQFGHAVVEYSIGRYGSHDDYKKWSKEDKTFIILNGGTTNNNEDRLGSLNKSVRRLEDICIPYATFNEPDLGNQLTAVVFLVDERVFDKEKYPDYEDRLNNPIPGTHFFQSDIDELPENYHFRTFGDDTTWILELREFLSQFKLA